VALRLIFMGTSDFAVPTLVDIVGRGHEVVAVYTRAPQPAGRGMDLKPSPVEQAARGFGLNVLTPTSLRTTEAQEIFRGHDADAAVVVAYGLILPKPILEGVPLGCFNLHASLLPRWRGAAPINRAVMAGDTESGVMVMRMDEGLDTGAVTISAHIAIGPDMTAGELHDALAPIGAGVIHTDFVKKFVRAEVYRYDDLLQWKSEKALKDKGLLRLEGKEYVLQDGDVCHFLIAN